MSAKIKAILASIVADMKDTWQRSKIVILTVGGLILALEFQKLKEMLIAYSAQKEMKNDNKKDEALATDEKAANTQADALVKEAQELPAQEQPVDVDWYKKDKK